MGSKENSPFSSNNNNKTKETAIVTAIAVAAGGLGLAAWGISKLFGSSDNRKKMKAPGRDYRIYREDFERDPANYFRNLRK